jgi:hypothetical protein
MDRFENARVFVTVVEAGGFTRAAERLACRAPPQANTSCNWKNDWARAFSIAPRAASA